MQPDPCTGLDLLAAIAWIDGKLGDLSVLIEGRDGLVLADIADATIRASAAHILESRGASARDHITVADTSDARAVLNAQPFNGDGVVPPTSADDAEVRAAMEDLLATVGLRATPWTGYYNTKFGFKVNDSVTVYPLPPQDADPALPSPFEYYEYDGCNFNFKLSQKSAVPTPPPNK